jgi:hypothetical protein
MKYKIVEQSDRIRLEEKIQQLINEGWTPLGGVSMGGGLSSTWYAQAMILSK